MYTLYAYVPVLCTPDAGAHPGLVRFVTCRRPTRKCNVVDTRGLLLVPFIPILAPEQNKHAILNVNNVVQSVYIVSLAMYFVNLSCVVIKSSCFFFIPENVY